MAKGYINNPYNYADPISSEITNGVNTLSIGTNGVFYNDERVFIPNKKGDGIGGGTDAKTYITKYNTYIKPTTDRIVYGLDVFNISNDGVYYNGEKVIESSVAGYGYVGGTSDSYETPKTDRIIFGKNVLNVANDGLYYNGVKVELNNVSDDKVYSCEESNDNFLWTPFESIYCQLATIKQDQKMQELSVVEYNSLCWKYLQFAIGLFQYDCRHFPETNELSKVQEFNPYYETSSICYGDGIDTDFYLKFPDRRDYNIFVEEKKVGEDVYTERTDYVYDIYTETIKFETPPSESSEIKITCYYSGFFNSKLDSREIYIMAEAMIIPFLEEQQNNRLLLNQIVYGGTTKIHSQAEHLKVVGGIISEQYNIVDDLIMSYGYKGNLDRSKGLSGFYTKKIE